MSINSSNSLRNKDVIMNYITNKDVIMNYITMLEIRKIHTCMIWVISHHKQKIITILIWVTPPPLYKTITSQTKNNKDLIWVMPSPLYKTITSQTKNNKDLIWMTPSPLYKINSFPDCIVFLLSLVYWYDTSVRNSQKYLVVIWTT